jgi:2-polyprenyl-6-hydroxyphenyl methylase/3-demethylubiquinone-9 3-methyltransferase
MGFLSTPDHGYLKNLALALSGKIDSHLSALWDDG